MLSPSSSCWPSPPWCGASAPSSPIAPTRSGRTGPRRGLSTPPPARSSARTSRSPAARRPRPRQRDRHDARRPWLTVTRRSAVGRVRRRRRRGRRRPRRGGCSDRCGGLRRSMRACVREERRRGAGPVAVVVGAVPAVHRRRPARRCARRATARRPRSTQLADQRRPSARRAGRVRSRQALPALVADQPAHEPLGGVLRIAGAVQRREPAVVDGHHSSHDSGVSYTTTPARARVTLGGRQGDVAAVAVAEHHRRPAGEQADEVGDVRVHRERPRVRLRPAVAPAVVAQHAVAVVEPPGQPEHAGRAVHRAVDQHDQRAVGGIPTSSAARSRSLDPHDPHHVGRGAAVRSGAPASTTTVSPWATSPLATACSTANHTMSSVDRVLVHLDGSTPHDSASARAVRWSGDTPEQSRRGPEAGHRPRRAARCGCSTGSPWRRRRRPPATRRG